MPLRPPPRYLVWACPALAAARPADPCIQPHRTQSQCVYGAIYAFFPSGRSNHGFTILLC